MRSSLNTIFQALRGHVTPPPWDGYVIEGHVPAADVRRLLKERPAVLGLAVPGMPIGSPGMEVPNVKPRPYNVMSFDRDGQLKVYSSH